MTREEVEQLRLQVIREEIRIERINSSLQNGDYYRNTSLWYNGSYFPRPKFRLFDMESLTNLKFIKRAKTYHKDGKFHYTKEGHIKITCRYCKKTQIINDISIHEIECPSNLD